MPLPFQFDIPAFIIFLGIVLGILLAYFFIRKSVKTNAANLFMGLLLLTFSLNMLEGWLNYTRLIFKVLHLTNFSEPTNFIIAPLLYLFIARQLGEKRSPREWLHYIPFVFWLLYCFFFFAQSADFKYNSNIYALRLDIEKLPVVYDFTDNPLGIRDYVNELTIFYILVYSVFMVRKIAVKSRSLGESFFRTTNTTLKSLRNSLYHFLILLLLLVVVKVYYEDDVGDYWLYLYLTFLLFMNTLQVMTSSRYFDRPSSFLEFPSLKYQKSSLTEEHKSVILSKIQNQISDEHYFLNTLASLSDLSKRIQESKHHVSQVINESMGSSFFELLAKERVEEAKRLLKSEEGKKLTIEEISERVGYNSKSAFNTVFKRLTRQTPAAYRDS